MKRWPRCVVLCAVLTSWPALAALPPKEQRAREFQAVVKRATAILTDPVTSVEHVETDRYQARSARCVVELRIVDARPAVRAVPWTGSRRFRVSAGEEVCR